MTKLALILMIAISLASGLARSESVSGRTGIGGRLGLQKLVGGDHDYANLDQHYGLWVRRSLSPRWSLTAQLNYGWNRPGALRGQDAGLTTGSVHAFYTTMTNVTVGARYHLATARKWTPYASGDVGLMDWKVRDENGQDFGKFPDGPAVIGFTRRGLPAYLEGINALATLGAGVEVMVSPQVGLTAGLGYTRIIGLDKDNIGSSALWGEVERDVNSGRWDIYVGGTYYFGGEQDRDHDGFANDRDGCPDAAEDFDGYRDSDGCPDPDNDADGVPDILDQCPGQAEDRDGFADDDGCPDPDNDGDGVLDIYDLCPDEAGVAGADGCPADDTVRSPRVPEIMGSMILADVTFLKNSDELTGTSFAALDRLLASLRAYPEVKIEIQGHTDSVGSEQVNLNIARRRANTIRNYLMGRGVDGGRLTAVGYGEAQPIADNATKAGREANRRVVIVRRN